MDEYRQKKYYLCLKGVTDPYTLDLLRFVGDKLPVIRQEGTMWHVVKNRLPVSVYFDLRIQTALRLEEEGVENIAYHLPMQCDEKDFLKKGIKIKYEY